MTLGPHLRGSACRSRVIRWFSQWYFQVVRPCMLRTMILGTSRAISSQFVFLPTGGDLLVTFDRRLLKIESLVTIDH